LALGGLLLLLGIAILHVALISVAVLEVVVILHVALVVAALVVGLAATAIAALLLVATRGVVLLSRAAAPSAHLVVHAAPALGGLAHAHLASSRLGVGVPLLLSSVLSLLHATALVAVVHVAGLRIASLAVALLVVAAVVVVVVVVPPVIPPSILVVMVVVTPMVVALTPIVAAPIVPARIRGRGSIVIMVLLVMPVVPTTTVIAAAPSVMTATSLIEILILLVMVAPAGMMSVERLRISVADGSTTIDDLLELVVGPLVLAVLLGGMLSRRGGVLPLGSSPRLLLHLLGFLLARIS
jgi:hypothetical protein